jgi:Tol biopolymer transport system component
MRAFKGAPSSVPTRFRIVPPSTQPLSIQGDYQHIAITPDGRNIVYLAVLNGGSTTGALAVRSLDQLDPKIVIAGVGVSSPFVSPDGQWIGFFDGSDGSLKKVSILGGPPVTLCQCPTAGRGEPKGASWGPDDTIIFANLDPSMGLLRVTASGGSPTVLTTPDTAAGEFDHVNPSFLPGGRAVLFTIITRSRQIDDAQIGVFDLQTGRKKILIRGGVDARYVDTGHLVYATAGTLRAVGFDLGRLEVTGTPVPVGEGVMIAQSGAASFDVARNGTLVYVPAVGSQRQLVWVDRKGREEPTGAPLRAYTQPRISPDGNRVAVDVYDQENDIWIWDLARETLTRLTFDPGLDRVPVWTPDGKRIIFSSDRGGVMNLYWQAADTSGMADRLTTSSNTQLVSSASRDGSVLFQEYRPNTAWDVMTLGLSPTPAPTVSRPPQPLVQTLFNQIGSRISPNGRWVSYTSGETKMAQIFVRPFPNGDAGQWQVTTNGGTRAVWARDDGRELFYQVNGAMMVVPVRTDDSTFSAGNPTKLFDAAPYYFGIAGHTYDVAPDGQRFLMIKNAAAADQNAAPSLIVAEHWTEELKTRVPTK